MRYHFKDDNKVPGKTQIIHATLCGVRTHDADDAFFTSNVWNACTAETKRTPYCKNAGNYVGSLTAIAGESNWVPPAPVRGEWDCSCIDPGAAGVTALASHFQGAKCHAHGLDHSSAYTSAPAMKWCFVNPQSCGVQSFAGAPEALGEGGSKFALYGLTNPLGIRSVVCQKVNYEKGVDNTLHGSATIVYPQFRDRSSPSYYGALEIMNGLSNAAGNFPADSAPKLDKRVSHFMYLQNDETEDYLATGAAARTTYLSGSVVLDSRMAYNVKLSGLTEGQVTKQQYEIVGIEIMDEAGVAAETALLASNSVSTSAAAISRDTLPETSMHYAASKTHISCGNMDCQMKECTAAAITDFRLRPKTDPKAKKDTMVRIKVTLQERPGATTGNRCSSSCAEAAYPGNPYLYYEITYVILQQYL